jgi:hypothetical protein
MKFVSDPKAPHVRTRFFLRIKEEVPIQCFDEFNRLKPHFSVVFMNKFNSQGNIHSHARKEWGKPEHLCFVAFGAARSGKTYTTQGYKDFPGLLPSFVSQLDFSSPVSVQIFEVKGDHVEDLIRQNALNFDESLGKPVRLGKLTALPVASETALNRVFKVVISRRMKRERTDEFNFVIRLGISPTKSLTIVESCPSTDANLPNLQFIRLLGHRSPAKLTTSKNTMVRLLMQPTDRFDPDGHFCFVFVGHLSSVGDSGEIGKLVSFVDSSF